jgi:serine/threonine protein kinase
MKVQDKKMIDENNCLKFIKSELSILRLIKPHPFIVKLHESFQNQKKLFLILEYCQTGNLSRILSIKKKEFGKGLVSESEAKTYICEIILAIEHLHKHNVIYRDLKPDNVLITQDGHVKITDFGLSKQIESEYEGSGSFCGSKAYMTPEMLEKKPHGKSIDWYGVGALLYELLVSVPPYFHTDEEKLYENILNAPLRIPQNLFSVEAESFIK